MGHASIDDDRLVHALIDGIGHAADLGDHAARNDAGGLIALDLGHLHLGDEGALVVLIPQQARDIGHGYQLLRFQRNRDLRSGGVGVHVVGLTQIVHAHRGDHGDEAAVQQACDQGSIHMHDLAHMAQLGVQLGAAQHLAVHAAQGDCTCCVCLPVTSLEVLPKVDQAGDNRLIDISARVGAGVKAYRELSFPTVTDAYSVCCDLETKSRNVDFAVIADKFNDTFTCRSTQDLPEARQILALWCSDLSKSVAQDSDGIIISGELTLHFLYTDAESQPCYAQRQTNYEYRRAVRKCGDLKCSPCIEITAASAACASGSADVRVEMNISGCIFDSVRRKTVTSIECSDSDGKKTGGAALTVYFADAGEEIWDIARRYNTTVEAVEQENGITGETVAQKCMLLIPGV